MAEDLLKPAEADILEIFDWCVLLRLVHQNRADETVKLLCGNRRTDQRRQKVRNKILTIDASVHTF